MDNLAAVAAVKVTEIQGKGRGLVAARDLRGGEVILRDSPLLLYSALPFNGTETETETCGDKYCFNCFKTILDPLQASSCPSCSSYLFCSPFCLSSSSANSHSPWVCQTLRGLHHLHHLHIHPIELQIQARFLVSAFNLSIVSPSKFHSLLSLHGQPSSLDYAAAHLLRPIFLSLTTTLPFFSLEITASLLAKDKFNAFGLSPPPLHSHTPISVRAYGLYPNASLFNHDCLPNACRFDYLDSAPHSHNTDLIFRLIHDVPQGREISLSYFPINENYSYRQKTLLEDFGFLCDCDRCKVEASWSDNDDDPETAMDEEQEEDQDEEMSDTEDGFQDGEQDDFPHSYFFFMYKCDRENCRGTLAPFPPTDAANDSQIFLECNVCGNVKKQDD